MTGILVDVGQTLEQNITMQPSSVRLQSVSVTAAAERGTVNEALDQQRTATGIVSAVTAEQITKSPDSENTIWSGCAVKRIAAAGDTIALRMFGAIAARGGRYKVLSLTNGL